MTRKEKIANNVEKAPKRKKAYADRLKAEKAKIAVVTLKREPSSPRKMRYVAALIRGIEVEKALGILKFNTRAGAKPLRKLVLAAVASWQAKNEDQRLDESGLFIKEISVDGGMMVKRLRPAPQGRANRIRKRSNHVRIILDSKIKQS